VQRRVAGGGQSVNVGLSQLIDMVWDSMRMLPWHWVALAAHVLLAALAVVHAMLYKRDPRAALGWVAVCLFFPLLGPLLYYLFGINRIQTQARRLARLPLFRLQFGYERGTHDAAPMLASPLAGERFSRFVQISDRVTSRPLSVGNTVEMLQNGEQAYPAMLAAINGAAHRVLLVTYLFEADAVGKAFVTALVGAQRRGVDVRVIVDGVGELYSWPRMSRALRRAGVQVVRFLQPRLLPPSFSVNLRNHRKILVVDGEYGFTGGMNIGARHLLESGSSRATTDLHFRLQGPVVAQLAAIFVEDWRFATGERLQTPPAATAATAATAPAGSGYCRCISDGPNEDLDKISLVLMGAISAAQQEILIMTPYFLPSREMIASLQAAALRGVAVTVILPRRSNLPFVDWATRNLLWELLLHGVTIRYQPPPFAHTKLFIVDGVYAQIGSANMDPRSLRLNFELNLEVIGTESVAVLLDHARQRRRESKQLTLQEIDGRGLLTRLRDAFCWLFMPYL
jgi:cardiolipin synthase